MARTADGRGRTDYRVGQDNLRRFGMDIHNPVFLLSAGSILAFVIGTLMFPLRARTAMDGLREWIITHCDWLFAWGADLILVYCLVLVVLPVGRIRIGGEEARPRFSTRSWFAMLFAAGMGIGLMFWSVAEPLAHYSGWAGTPLEVAPDTPEAARAALGATLFHWGLHPWAIYALPGSHAPAWEQIPTLQRRSATGQPQPMLIGTVGKGPLERTRRHSHAGAWEREWTGLTGCYNCYLK